MRHPAAQRAIIFGIAVGFAYQLGLATAQISVCERQRAGKCETEWAQGFAVSSGLLSTLLAYFIEAPGGAPATTIRRTTSARPPEDDPAATAARGRKA
jgi:hypothetical protein